MLTRREFLLSSAAATFLACAPTVFSASRSKPRCRPAISGPLWWISADECSRWGLPGWRDELGRQRRLKFDLLWLVNAPRLLENAAFSLRDLMDLCAQHKLRVILDTGFNGDWYRSLDLKTELKECTKNIHAIGSKLGAHPAFFAWYIPHEIYMCWGPMDDYIRQLYPGLVEACKKSAPLPVTVSPFFILDRTKTFGDFQFNEPDEYRAYWAGLIRTSGLDIVMLQDSGEHFSYVTNEQRRPFFAAMSQACRESGARLWGNVEVAEMVCPSVEEYARIYGRVHHSAARNIPWRPVPITRLKEKLLLAAEYSETIVSWGYQEFCRPDLGSRAAEWYRAYRQYRRRLP